jgi:hypothetical protein
MKTSIWLVILFFAAGMQAFPQEANWRLDLYNFFDNVEFGRSAYKIPQTMAGIAVSPEAGVVWDTVNKVNIGVSLIHEYGSPEAIAGFFPTAYYESDRGPLRFVMGAFPRSRTLGSYPRLFFQDSVSYYRPNINGLFTEYRKGDNYLNVWIDWTGRQSLTVNEQFFIGFSGKYKTGIFYVQHYGAMFHYAAKSDPVVEEPLHDNLLFLTSAGIDLAGKTLFDKLETNVGWAVRRERSRADNSGWITSGGFMMETRIEYKWFGFFNTFFKGDNMMYYYPELGNKLYWGDPLYRSGNSDRADFYISFLRHSTVNLNFTYSLAFLEKRIYHEQMLKVIVNLNSLKD